MQLPVMSCIIWPSNSHFSDMIENQQQEVRMSFLLPCRTRGCRSECHRLWSGFSPPSHQPACNTLQICKEQTTQLDKVLLRAVWMMWASIGLDSKERWKMASFLTQHTCVEPATPITLIIRPQNPKSFLCKEHKGHCNLAFRTLLGKFSAQQYSTLWWVIGLPPCLVLAAFLLTA